MSSGSRDSVAARADELRWYHTLDLGDGVVTRGEYDLRPIAPKLPWPDLTGVRCLDVGSRDGFYAFEMERRGASEVVSIDLDDPDGIAFPGSGRPSRELVLEELNAGNRAFAFAKEALGSQVQRRMISVYDLAPDAVGTFGFATIGTLLLHLRDPVGALAAIRRVVDGHLLINEAVALNLDIFRRRPTAGLVGQGGPFWWAPNPSALARMAEAAGFRVVKRGRPYMVPLGRGSRVMRPPPIFARPLRDVPGRVLRRKGMLHVWLLASTT
jgi:tRNA (mo5U34)-methyltransferase